MRSLIILALLSGLNTYAAKVDSGNSTNIFLDKDGKQISAMEAYKSEAPVYECTKKEVHFNQRTGKPTLKKVD